ncbi:MAG: thioredoxin domain-containing protein [Deltaproteobacteria bacterium]|nr:thioredoxin domain-containing protein [Deltaproteobacteria bacterium]
MSANRLVESTSPYLLQHAHNPVDWYPWGEEAFARARALDRPIFLSIGYSACHWCHVMAEESFEDPEVAAVLNGRFVPVKVDRQEKPEIDDLYMAAVQALTGRGGWPLSVWITPDLRPFYGGTYFPRDDGRGLPGFLGLLGRMAALWEGRRDEVVAHAAALTESLARRERLPEPAGVPGPEAVREGIEAWGEAFDPVWGGFGPPPKFPQPAVLLLLLRRGDAEARAMAIRTLDALAAGGIRDHGVGGFARYAVDTRWVVPHFEKMLPDNALLSLAFLEAFGATRDARYAHLAAETLDWLDREMSDPAGGFHASEDADVEGVEGGSRTWTPAEVHTVLGPHDGALACAAFGVTPDGHVDGRSVIHRVDTPADLAARSGLAPEALEARLAHLLGRLGEVRATRPRPRRDDTVVACWNGLALSALARASLVLGDPGRLARARRAASFLLAEMVRGSVVLRSWRQGVAGSPGVLEDQAAMGAGFLDLWEADPDTRWLEAAILLAEGLVARFADPSGGACLGAASDRTDLVIRQKPHLDGAHLSGNALAAGLLLGASRLADRPDLGQVARDILVALGPLAAEAPRAVPGLLDVLASFHAPNEGNRPPRLDGIRTRS